MQFQFNSGQILFGEGRARELPDLVDTIGDRPFVITGSHSERHKEIVAWVQGAVYALKGEPSIENLNEALEHAKGYQADCVVGIGGGSAIDLAKAVAAMLRNKGDVLDYLEVIGKGQPLERNAFPTIAIPTTSGTGAEVTKNAVLYSEEHKVKVSLRHNSMVPSIALVDPELTYGLPPNITASTGLDALTQLIEVFLTKKANPLTDGLVREALPAGAKALKVACEYGDNVNARRDMCLASLFSGMGLANSGLGAVHGFAGALGGMVSIPHGTACAILLPHCLEANVRTAQQSGELGLISRFTKLAEMILGPAGDVSSLVRWASDMVSELSIGKLSDFGFQESQIPELVEKAQKASSMRGNRLPLPDEILTAILQQAL